MSFEGLRIFIKTYGTRREIKTGRIIYQREPAACSSVIHRLVSISETLGNKELKIIHQVATNDHIILKLFNRPFKNIYINR